MLKREPLLIILVLLIGITMRVYLIETNNHFPQSSYSSIAKVNIKHDLVQNDLRDFLKTWHTKHQLDTTFFQSNLSGKPRWSQLHEHLEQSNHPPLYYHILHTIHTVSGSNGQTLFKGLYLNILFWVLSVLLFNRILKIIDFNEVSRLTGLLILATSLAALNISITVKAYELQMTLMLLLICMFLKHTRPENPVSWKHLLSFSSIATCFLLVHYFSYIFLALLGLLIAAYYWFFQRSLRIVFYYFCTIIFSVFIALSIYPKAIIDITGDYRSLEIQEIVTSGNRLDGLVESFEALMLVYPLGIIAAFIFSLFWCDFKRLKTLKNMNLVIALSVFSWIAYIVPNVISAGPNIRFGTAVFPLMVLPLIYFLNEMKKPIYKWVITSVFLVVSLFAFKLYLTNGSNRIHNYEKKVFNKMKEDHPLFIITPLDTSAEEILPYLYHMPNQHVAMSHELDLKIIAEKPEAQVLILTRDKKFQKELISYFEHRDYKRHKIRPKLNLLTPS